MLVDNKHQVTPSIEERTRDLHTIHINCEATEDQVKKKICEEFEIPGDETIVFMYAYGHKLRLATLSNISGATEWDARTVHALMAVATCMQAG